MKDKLIKNNPRFKTLYEYMEKLKSIQSYQPTRDPATIQAKDLGITQAMIQIELIETLIELDDSNKQLSRSNLYLQILVTLLAVASIYAQIKLN